VRDRPATVDDKLALTQDAWLSRASKRRAERWLAERDANRRG
jgi:hypothetical protein